jgi:hypothetical protein
MATGAVIARIISQYSDKGTRAAEKDIQKMGRQIDAWSKRVVKSYAIAGAAVAAFAYKIGKEAVSAAIEDSKSATMLANSLRNVTGATTEQIAAVEDYISKQQMLTNVQDTELRASLNTLVAATGNVTHAQYLQTVALDAAAGSGKELAAVTNAMAKASKGNYTALGKLFPQLDKATLKSGDFGKMLAMLEGNYKGAAEAIADQDPLTKLKLQFGEIAEQLGYALLPVVKEFATYLITDVIPNIQEWIALNKTELANSFKSVLNIIERIVTGLITLTAFFEKYKILILTIAAIPVINVIGNQIMILAGIMRIAWNLSGKFFSTLGKAGGVFRGFATAISLATAAFRAGGFIAGLKGVIQLLGMLSPQLRIATALVAGLATGWALVSKLLGNNKTQIENLAGAQRLSTQAQKESILAGFKSIEVATKKANADKAAAAAIAKNAAAAAKAAKEEEKNAKAKALRAAIQKKIESKFGVKFSPTGDEYGAIQDAAVARNLKRSKEGVAYLESMNKLTQINNDLNKEATILLQRQGDIVEHLDKLRQNDLVVLGYLAKKWDMTTEAADAYIKSVLAISDNKVEDYEVILLAKAWGATEAQARMYLDFFQAINDGKLSDAEIAKLQERWGMTQKEVLLYADFVRVVNDGKLTDEEIKKLQDRWGLTVQEISDYIFKLGAPVTYSGTLIDPAIFAKNAWLDAIAALERYIKMLGGVPGGVPGGKGFVPGSGEDPAVIADAAKAAAAAADAAAAAAAALAESEAALAALDAAASAQAASDYALAKLLGDKDAMAIAAAGVNPSTLAAAESGAIGAASIASQLKKAEEELAQRLYYSNLASFRAKEAADAAQAGVLGGSMSDAAADAAERARFRALTQGTVNTASGMASGGNLMAGGSINVTVNVAGSVTAEQDLVQSVRNGLLAAQYNGNQITLEAI